MPAAAVIPAPVAYIKVVAVKKLVVRTRVRGRSRGPGAAAPSSVVDFGRPCAFPALSAGVDCHVHPPRGPAGENLLLREEAAADDGRGAQDVRGVGGTASDADVVLTGETFFRNLSASSVLFPALVSFPSPSTRCFIFRTNVSSCARVCGRAVSPPRVLLTECPRRPVRSL